MDYKKMIQKRNSLYNLIDQRDKMLKRVEAIQEKIDRERRSVVQPKAYESKNYTPRAYSYDHDFRKDVR